MSEVSANEQIGQRLRLLRTEKGVSQKEAAAALGVSQSMLSHYEQGLRECSMASLFAACTYYEVSADYLLGLEEHACLRLSSMQLRESQLALILSLIQEYRRCLP